MRREKAALLLLLTLLALSGWNISKANKLSTEIGEKLSTAEKAAKAQDFRAAELAMEGAITIWLNAESYTHIFIRHSEIDSCSDCFYDAMDAVMNQDQKEISVSMRKLRYHLESIASMERLSFGNIF